MLFSKSVSSMLHVCDIIKFEEKKKKKKKEEKEQKEGNVLFNDALNTFYLWLYDVMHMVKDHSDSERKPVAATTWAMLSD